LCNLNFFPNKESYYPEILESQDSFRIYPIAKQFPLANEKSLNHNYFPHYKQYKQYLSLMGYGDIRDVIKQYSFIKYPLDYSNVTGYTSVSGYSWVIAPNYFLTMYLNFPTYKKIHSLIGYRDSLESDVPENLIIYENISTNNLFQMFKAYGVKYVILEKYSDDSFHLKKPSGLDLDLKKVYSKNGINYYEFPYPDPLAFIFDHPEKPILIKFNGQGAVVNVSSLNKPEKIVINMLLRPNMNIFDDKNKHIDVKRDEWGRIVANINEKSRTITVQYMPKWGLGFELGALLLIASILTMKGVIYLNKK